MASSQLYSVSDISTLGSTRCRLFSILTYQSMTALLQLGKYITSCSHGGEHFQSPLTLSGELHISSSCLSSSGSVHISSETGHRPSQTYHFQCALLCRGSLASQSSQHAGIQSFLMYPHKRAHQGYFSRLPLLNVTLLLLRDVCCKKKTRVFFLSLLGSGGRHVQQRSTSMMEKIDS